MSIESITDPAEDVERIVDTQGISYDEAWRVIGITNSSRPIVEADPKATENDELIRELQLKGIRGPELARRVLDEVRQRSA